MSISIVDYGVQEETHNIYDVTFFGEVINTLVTHTPALATKWITEVVNLHARRIGVLVVGLDIEWHPNESSSVNNPVATLQLCIGHQCLIFQFLFAPYIPAELADFLFNTSYTFVGVGIGGDVVKLLDDYALPVTRTVDLRKLAADQLGKPRLNHAGLKALAKEVLGKDFEKPLAITLSSWDNKWLAPPQVQYACIDAFVSFEIGRSLNASQHWIPRGED